MFTFTTGVLVGMLVGWNLLPQPAFIKNTLDKAWTAVKGWF